MMKSRMPDFRPDAAFLREAQRVLREDSVETAIKARPKSSVSRPKAGGYREAREALCHWAMMPCQEHADAALAWMAELRGGVEGVDEERLLQELTESVERDEGLMWNLMIFLALHLSEGHLRATASLGLCVLYPVQGSTASGLLAGPQLVADLAADGRLRVEQRAALIAGVLHLGEPRTSRFQLGTWKRMPVAVRRAAAMILPGVAHVPYIDFLMAALAWESDPAAYGGLAGQLGRFASFGGEERPFVRAERAFPCWGGGASPFVRMEVFTREDVFLRIRTELQRLKAQETGDERVMPTVLACWQSGDDADESLP